MPPPETRPSVAARVVALPLIGLIQAYRLCISPLTGASCRFQPTCSAYAREALQRYGAAQGGWLALRRLARCHPWGGAGYDPVPDPVEPGEEREAELRMREREQVLNHAYGFFSRGNSEGGMTHIVNFIDRYGEFDATIDEYRWFFNRMTDWEATRPALDFGTRFLERLVAAERYAEAMKTLSRCLHKEPGFRPPAALRNALSDIARDQGREDLLQQLR